MSGDDWVLLGVVLFMLILGLGVAHVTSGRLK